MKRFLSIFTVLFLLAAAGCEEKILEGTGIITGDWDREVLADKDGEVLSLNFEAGAAWTAVSAEEWCQLLTSEGVAGSSSLRLKVDKNTGIEERTTVVVLTVEGYELQETIQIRQEAGVVEKGDGRYRDVNEWVYQNMCAKYLWNEPVKSLALDFSIDYQAFLKSILDGVSENGDLNHDDGAYNGELRTQYYTEIISNAPLTKAVGERIYGNGFYKLLPVDLGVAIGVAVDAVVPDSPADKAGFVRGHFITAVNGIAITRDNYKSVTQMLYDDKLSVTVNTVEWEGEYRDKAVVTPAGNINIVPDYYTDPAIYKSKVMELNNGAKVGYLMYMGFSTAFDEDLIAAFDVFRQEGISDLVLDLRYNNGGEIISSNLLATLIAGQEHKDEILAKLTFNAERTEAGETALYRIGNPETIEYPDGYELLETALQHSLGLDRIFVITSGYTASASEIIINGLRGLDIEVNLIGTRTSGKNVGMEGFRSTFHSYAYLFYPVSFYIENAKGFSDYPDGFVPDMEWDTSGYYPGGDFGSSSDHLCGAAYAWIEKGSKPVLQAPARTMSMGVLSYDRVTEDHLGGSLVLYLK